MTSKKHITAVLAGNPNCGKTTMFNALTGSNQHTGNWAGVTVEKKTGFVKNSYGKKIKLVDLPGIYSLYPFSPEEKAAMNYLLHEKPDIIINIVDSTNLERNLYLTTQLAQLNIPMVTALNMYDMLEKRGNKLDVLLLEKNFNIKFIPVSASKGTGIENLIKTIIQICKSSVNPPNPKIFSQKTENAIEKLSEKTENRFIAVQKFENINSDNQMIIADERYNFICKVIETALSEKKKNDKSISDKIDKIATHRFFAIPIFIMIIALIFGITFGSFGEAAKHGAEYIIHHLFENCVKNLLISVNASDIIQSMVLDGIISGVGSVITFLPQIAILFSLLSVLEDSGYMARAIFITDRILRYIGLSGKSFVPIIMGFGCTVPALMSTRTLDNSKEKKLAVIISPFMSCSAKMPVYMLFASSFFGRNSAIVILFIYFIGIAIAVVTAIFYKDYETENNQPFIMELPSYHIPSLKNVFLHTWDRVKDFLTRAGSILMFASIIIWFLNNYNFQLQPANEQNCMLAQAGRFIAPVFSICGFGSWQAAVSLLSGIAAKESIASTLSVLYAKSELKNSFTPLSAFSFMTFVLLYPPCIAATTALYRETNKIRQIVLSVSYHMLSAWLVSALIYQSGTLLINLADI